jgi:hypothetical protein
MKIRLLNDGGYSFMTKVKFPVLVDADFLEYCDCFDVSGEELKRIGATKEYHRRSWAFSKFHECEIVECAE